MVWEFIGFITTIALFVLVIAIAGVVPCTLERSDTSASAREDDDYEGYDCGGPASRYVKRDD